jgi:SAM-dependent methyltransferase
LHAQSEFVLASADNLTEIPDQSVDVVTTRSVLIFVPDKQHAFNEFYRVLKPGGRVSIFEPINRFHPLPRDQFYGHDITPVQPIVQKLKEVILLPDDDPMMDFGIYDLMALAEGAGFVTIEVRFQAAIKPQTPQNWTALLKSAGNPKAPTLEEAILQALTLEEARQFTDYLQPLVEQGAGKSRSAVTYLWATKP